MNHRTFVRIAGRTVLAGLAFMVFLALLGRLMEPALGSAESAPSSAELRAVEEARAMTLHPDDPPVLVREVDYSHGPSAAWYPKGEAPILAELVSQGKLPPAAERVGPEPVVVEGVEGIGKYGGTWLQVSISPADLYGMAFCYYGYQTLVRWSPEGYPLVPHIAKRWEISADNREYIFHLRKGMRWSDGHPFTADDILYWWNEEQLDKSITPAPIPIMRMGGQLGELTKIDDLTFKVTFAKPYGMFLENLAGPWGLNVPASPAHYLRQYHPRLGDPDLIRREMSARNLPTPLALYTAVKGLDNPELPRLAPWILRTYRSNSPFTFVRNPYYFMVDTEGNQLPYVDRRLVQVKSPDMIGIAAGSGEVTMQERHIRYSDYTYLMSQREKAGFDVLLWYQADRGNWTITLNLNRVLHADRPETRWQHELLNDRRFRQALSLAINRQAIIDAEYNGQTEPAQLAPGPDSMFYEPTAYKNYTEYDPERANRLLDEVGLTRRDAEGYRTYPDGTRMTWYLPIPYADNYLTPGPAQFIREDWERVGLRTVIRQKSSALFGTELFAMEQPITVIGISQVEHAPILEPRFYVPMNSASTFALGYAKWYANGGLYGSEDAIQAGSIAPPLDSPVRQTAQLYERILSISDLEEQKRLSDEMLRIAAENVWTINICTPPPLLAVVKKGFRNVPRVAVTSWMFQAPGNTGIETYFFDQPYGSPGAVAQIRDEILRVTPAPRSVSGAEAVSSAGDYLRRVITYALVGIALAGIVLAGVRHPFVGRRLLIMVPMLLLISVVSFVIIQLPPGDYATSMIMQLKQSGSEGDLQRIEQLKEQFWLDDPLPVRYARWMGLYWFISFDAKDAGLLQGNMGRSMESGQSVNDLVGERLLLTFLISLGTILFTWALAVPIGIYSAVRQYSMTDYVLTFVGFIGMCVPAFLLALILIYLSTEFFDVRISGLFSADYAAQPEWDWPKVKDLLQHIWVPVVVLGVGGTAGMIRVMRGNLLDELNKPYVVTALAKGMRPGRLLLKYPVRLALNPFISGIGGVFPALVSGGAIVEIVLSLPTVGPLLLNALMSEDMYLAGSLLMLLSILAIFGTLVSDLLLLWLDPRIRWEGGSR